jgi:mono/diheme cytochrome c family protein
LLENLKLPEYRARYRTRRELREHPATEVIPAVKSWVASLDPKDPNYERWLCEAMWATWAQNQVDRELLMRCFSARSHQARAAAAHVLRYEFRNLPNSTALFLQAANDPHPRVRLEAIVAASWLDDPTGARIALEAVRHPFDRWMGPVYDLIMKRTLADDVQELEQSGALVASLADNPRAADYLAGRLDLAKIAPTEANKPQGPTRELTTAERQAYDLGREIFMRDGHCVSCHQPNGAGIANIYPPLTAKNNPWITDSDERLIKIVWKGLWGPMELAGQQFDPGRGVPPMPGFGPVLNDEEVAAVINYVRQSFGNDLPFIPLERVKAVRAKTEDRRDFYLVEDLMKEHPIPGWERWQQAATKLESFE